MDSEAVHPPKDGYREVPTERRQARMLKAWFWSIHLLCSLLNLGK